MNELTLTNRALRLAKLDTIESLDDTGPIPAYCRENLQSFIDESLSDMDWSFAKTRKPLIRLELSYADWEYVFDVPDDMIRWEHLVLPGGNHRTESLENEEFEFFNDDSLPDKAKVRLATNMEELEMVYTKRITVVPRLPDYFTNALSYLYAYYLATSFGGIERANWAFQTYIAKEQIANIQDRKIQRKNVKGQSVLVSEVPSSKNRFVSYEQH